MKLEQKIQRLFQKVINSIQQSSLKTFEKYQENDKKLFSQPQKRESNFEVYYDGLDRFKQKPINLKILGNFFKNEVFPESSRAQNAQNIAISTKNHPRIFSIHSSKNRLPSPEQRSQNQQLKKNYKHRRQISAQLDDKVEKQEKLEWQEHILSPSRFFKKPNIANNKNLPGDFIQKVSRTNSFRTYSNNSQDGKSDQNARIHKVVNIMPVQLPIRTNSLILKPSASDLITIQHNKQFRILFNAQNFLLYLQEIFPIPMNQISQLKLYIEKCLDKKLITDVWWNSPEGMVSVISTYSRGHKVDELIEKGGLSEISLMKICQQIQNQLLNQQKINIKENIILDPSNIFITEDENLKIIHQINSLFYKKNDVKQSIYKYYQILQYNGVLEQIGHNSFEFGIFILQCLFGEFLELTEQFKEKTLVDQLSLSRSIQQKYFFYSRNFFKNTCCIFHQIQNNSSFLSCLFDSQVAQNLSQLAQKVSPSIQQIICSLLHFDIQKRVPLKQINFQIDSPSCIIHLDELIQINKQPPLQNGEEAIDRICQSFQITLLDKDVMPASKDLQQANSLLKEISETYGKDYQYVLSNFFIQEKMYKSLKSIQQQRENLKMDQ